MPSEQVNDKKHKIESLTQARKTGEQLIHHQVKELNEYHKKVKWLKYPHQYQSADCWTKS